MAKNLPKAPQFLVADTVIQESGGKLNIIGLYPGGEVVLQGELPKEVPKGVQGLALQGLTVVILLVDGYGKIEGKINFYDPAGKQFGKGISIEAEKRKEQAHSIILPVIPFPITAFGRYRVELQLNDRAYEHFFTVRHSDPAVSLPTFVERKQKARRPSRAKTRTEPSTSKMRKGRTSK